jgi:hypothetical protein
MIICGPFLIFIGIYLLFDAAGVDERLLYIADYNKLVDTWNEKGATDFEGISFTATVSNGTKVGNVSAYAIQPGVSSFTAYAPNDFPDTGYPDEIQRKDKETFTKTKKRVAYKIGLTRVNTYTAGWKSVQQTLTLGGAGLDNTFNFESVVKVPGKSLKYNWYVDKSSSDGPDTITCKAPPDVYSQYPGTRFNKKILCKDWCEANNGEWKGTTAKCYPSSMAKQDAPKTDTGCCKVPDSYLGLKQISLVATCTSKTSCKIDASKASTGGSMNAWSDFKATPYTNSNLLGEVSGFTNVKRSGILKNDQYPALIYAPMGKTIDWRAAISLDVTIRSVQDPYYASSKIYKGATGCVSGTDVEPYKMYDEFAYKKGAQCFGATPGQKASSGLMLIVIGAILLSPFCCVIYFARSQGKSRKGGGSTPNPVAGAPSSVIEMVA